MKNKKLFSVLLLSLSLVSCGVQIERQVLDEDVATTPSVQGDEIANTQQDLRDISSELNELSKLGVTVQAIERRHSFYNQMEEVLLVGCQNIQGVQLKTTVKQQLQILLGSISQRMSQKGISQFNVDGKMLDAQVVFETLSEAYYEIERSFYDQCPSPTLAEKLL